MKFTQEYLKNINNNYYIEWQDKALINLIFMRHTKLISEKSFKDLSLSIIRGKTPHFRGTYQFAPTNDWFNGENTEDIFKEVLSKYRHSITPISFEKMIEYVGVITGQPRNLVINTIFDVFVKPIILHGVAYQYENDTFDYVLNYSFGLNLELEKEKPFLYHYVGNMYECGYWSYERNMICNLLKKKLHKIAKEYYKGRYNLNPRYVRTEDFNYTLSENEHIFEIISGWNETPITSLIHTKHR